MLTQKLAINITATTTTTDLMDTMIAIRISINIMAIDILTTIIDQIEGTTNTIDDDTTHICTIQQQKHHFHSIYLAKNRKKQKFYGQDYKNFNLNKKSIFKI
jgi:hypothetical protein